MNENQISGEIIDACIKIHKALGPGLFETVYETVLAYELRARGYLRLSDKRVGLLINFNTELMKDGITRVVN